MTAPPICSKTRTLRYPAFTFNVLHVHTLHSCFAAELAADPATTRSSGSRKRKGEEFLSRLWLRVES